MYAEVCMLSVENQFYKLSVHIYTCAISAASSNARLCVTGNLPATISPFVW